MIASPASPPPQYIPPPYNSGTAYQAQGGKQEGPTPVEVAGSPGTREHRILGMKPRTFWRNFAIVAIILVALIVGLAVGLTVTRKNNRSDPVPNPGAEEITTTSAFPTRSTRTTSSASSASDGPTPTPGGVYAVPTGVWVMPLTLASTSGRCAPSTVSSIAAIRSCTSSATYTATVSGNVQSGYRMTGDDVFVATDRVNVQGLQPNGTSLNIDSDDRRYWSFTNTEEGKEPCAMREISIWLFGRDKSTYSMGWSSRNGESCLLRNGLTAPVGTTCTCFYLAG